LKDDKGSGLGQGVILATQLCLQIGDLFVVLLACRPESLPVGQLDAGKGQIPPRKQLLDGDPLLIAKCHQGVPLQFTAVRNQGELDGRGSGLGALGHKETAF